MGHFWKLNKGEHPNAYLQNAYNKYGKENFIFEVQEYVKRKDLLKREQEWLDEYWETEMLYNIARYAEATGLGRKISGETRRKMSLAQKGENHPNWGKTRSKETCLKISKSQIGKKVSKKQREKNVQNNVRRKQPFLWQITQ